MTSRPVILVVDDDGPILTLMRALLGEYGFEPVVANTGTRALELARQRTPDLVLLDRNMPEMSGDEVVRALRAETGMAQLPILILSGEPVENSELSAIGANGAVQKPFDVTALIDQIRATIGAAA
jgi:two-component system, OmpR family, phosphate regulon response regulator PhoB